MARLKTLQFHLTLTPPFHCHAYIIFSLYHHFFSWSVIGVFGLISCDPRFMVHIESQWFVKFSKMANINFRESWFGFFFINRDFWPETPHPPPFKVFVYYKGVLNRSKFTNIFFFNFHLYFSRHSPLLIVIIIK
jgi:hypothetical protein